MPPQIPFDWREDETSLIFVLSTPGVKAKNLSVAICDVYVKVNLPLALFEVDLLHEIDPEHPKTRCRVSPNKVTVTLQKRVPQIWDEFRAAGAKADLRVRRQAALDALEQREAERLQKRKDFKEEMLKQGEHAQWRLDSQNRETIEKWEQEEKEKWEEEVYRSFDSATGDLLESERRDDLDALDVVSSEVQPPLDQEVEETSEPQVVKPEEPIWSEEDLADTEEYVPDVRDNPGKIGLRFTERPRPGVPVRDRGRKPAPFPKEAPKTELPPMLAGDEREEDENDPVWLKDKGDQLMVRGDYTGAYNAYTEALKLASNARCFANRALTSLYLGNFEQCLEDCNRSIQILDFRNKPRNGELHHSADPEDEKVRARVEIRMGVAFLWLGAFKKAEAHFEKALGTEGLDAEEIKQVRQDLERVQSAYRALKVKDQADQSLRQGDEEAVEKALELYGQADHTTKQECAVVMANRCLAHLQTSQLQQCLEDASMALMALKRWPVARAVKAPKRPTRLDPPYLDDPTFVHPDKQNQGEREWLMKHNGGNAKELPGLPDEYEWIKDVAEKNENAWIAVKKRMSKVTFDAIKRATAELQDALYTRQPEVIRQQMEVAKDQNKVGEGPSSKAILQAEDYAKKLEDYAKEQEAQREHEEEELQKEATEVDLKEALVPSRAGRSQAGFASSHPLQRSRKRLFVKILLRRARAYELLGQRDESMEDLRAVLKVEPENREAQQRCAMLQQQLNPLQEDVTETDPALPTPEQPETVGPEGPPEERLTGQGPAGPSEMEQDEDEDEGVDHASTSQLISSAAEYIQRGDYASALQIYSYARRTCRSWESPVVELKVLSNTSLCLQNLRGRLPELVQACNDTLRRIREIREDGWEDELFLLRIEAACLSRRGSAFEQQRKKEESAEDALRVKELLGRIAEVESVS